MACWLEIDKQDDEPRAVLFLDRDGVVIVDQDYLSQPAGVELLPGVAEAMKLAHRKGMLIVGVSNQSGLGRGKFSLEDFEQVMARLSELLAAEGAHFDGFYYCPHAPEAACLCRKPKLGLLTEISSRVKWDGRTSWMVGDKLSDVAWARSAEMGAALVKTGYGAQHLAEVEAAYGDDECVFVAADLPSALSLLLAQPSMKKIGGDA